MVNLTAPDPIAAPTTTAPPPTTTTIPPIEARVIPAPEDGISGTYMFRGDPGRSGLTSGGFREVDGYYWRLEPGGSFVPTTSPVAFGRQVFVVTDESKIYGYELTGGRLNMVIEADNPITATPAIGQPSGSETVDPLIVFPTNDGVIHGYSAVRNGAGVWRYPTESSIRAAALIIEQSVFVATTDGHIHAIDLLSGDGLWRYPADAPDGSDSGEEVPQFDTPPSFSDGVLYATSREGSLHVIDAATGEPRCDRPINLQGSVNSHPVITDGVVLVGLENPPGIHAFAAGTCGNPPAGYSAFYPSSAAVRAGLAATPETMYLLENRLLLAVYLDAQLWLEVSEAAAFPSPWEEGPFGAADIVTTPPVVADGAVYLGSQDGKVHAIDVEIGEALWSFDAESAVRGELVVVPGTVIVTTAAGEVIAIAGH